MSIPRLWDTMFTRISMGSEMLLMSPLLRELGLVSIKWLLWELTSKEVFTARTPSLSTMDIQRFPFSLDRMKSPFCVTSTITSMPGTTFISVMEVSSPHWGTHIYFYTRYGQWVRGFKKAFLDIYLEKNWGPPYYRLKKTFKNPDPNSGEGFLSKLLPAKHWSII